MKLTKFERESVLTFNEAEHTAELEIHAPKLKKRLETIRAERPDEIKLTRQDEYANFYIVPKSWIKINPPRSMTSKQLESLAKARVNAKPFVRKHPE